MIAIITISIIALTLIAHLAFDRTRLIYLDIGKNRKTFYNDDYGIAARPDKLMLVYKGVVDLYEHKSRSNNIYLHDKVQAVSTAIAVSSKYRVRQIIIELKSGKKEALYFKSVKQMHGFVKDYHEQAVEIEKRNVNKIKYIPELKQCRRCSLRSTCQYRASYKLRKRS